MNVLVVTPGYENARIFQNITGISELENYMTTRQEESARDCGAQHDCPEDCHACEVSTEGAIH